MKYTQEQKQYVQIVEKAWEDAQFKAALVTNPVAAIEQLTGQKLDLPEGKTLVVRDQTDVSTVYINIPAKLNTENVELNEDQLEAVAGGKGGIIDGGCTGPFEPWTTLPIKGTVYF